VQSGDAGALLRAAKPGGVVRPIAKGGYFNHGEGIAMAASEALKGDRQLPRSAGRRRSGAIRGHSTDLQLRLAGEPAR